MEERFEKFTALITNINRCIKKIKTEEMVEFNLKGHHVVCVYYLRTRGSLTSRELCDLCEEDKANLSRTLEYLENNGYIVKESNRYRSPFTLSQKGIEIGNHIIKKIDNVLKITSLGISDSERETMYLSLERVSENLQKLCEEYSE